MDLKDSKINHSAKANSIDLLNPPAKAGGNSKRATQIVYLVNCQRFFKNAIRDSISPEQMEKPACSLSIAIRFFAYGVFL